MNLTGRTRPAVVSDLVLGERSRNDVMDLLSLLEKINTFQRSQRAGATPVRSVLDPSQAVPGAPTTV